MPLLYFVESEPGKPLTDATTAPIRYACAGEMARSPIKGSTPSGSPGIIFARNPVEFDVAYKPAEQHWQKIPGARAWVGVYNDSPPTPQELRRVPSLPGVDMQLGDGHEWTIPVVRVFPEPFTPDESRVLLPHTMALDDDGKWTQGELVPKYRWLLEAVTPYWDAWHAAFIKAIEDEDETGTFEPGDIYTMAAKVLSANYLIGPAECSLLGLFNTYDCSAADVVEWSLSIPVAREWYIKKKEAALSGSGSGPGLAD